jgi:hypothetical protein
MWYSYEVEGIDALNNFEDKTMKITEAIYHALENANITFANAILVDHQEARPELLSDVWHMLELDDRDYIVTKNDVLLTDAPYGPYDCGYYVVSTVNFGTPC